MSYPRHRAHGWNPTPLSQSPHIATARSLIAPLQRVPGGRAILLKKSLDVGLQATLSSLKLGTFGLSGTMGYFASIGYPAELGALVALGETAAGLALLAGVLVRVASLAAVPIMLGAVAQHFANGWLFTAPGGGWEFPAVLAAAFLVQAGLGAGAWALRPDARGSLVATTERTASA